MDTVTFRTGESGELNRSWRVVAGNLAPAFAEQLIKQGEEARAALPAGHPRRSEIGVWISAVRAKGFVPPGSYPLKGRAVVFVEKSTDAARMAVRERCEMAGAIHRARRLPGTADDSRERRAEWHKRMTAAGAAAIERFEASRSA